MAARAPSDTDADDALLVVAYRSRPATVNELAEAARLPFARVAASVSRLAERGLLVRHDDRLTYPHPAAWASDEVARDLDAMRRSGEEVLTRVERLVSGLPNMLRQWSVGEVASELVPVLTRHGPRAAEDLWYDTSRSAPGSAEAVFPDVTRFLASDPDRSARFTAAFAGKEAVRAILPASIASEPSILAVAARYADAGVQFRTLDDPPSWFWIDGDMLAVPFEWGEAWPTSVLGVRHSALAAGARSLFDQLWQRADPLGAVAQPWTPLLRLMRQGLTLDAASRTLGINPRTGRRRVAAAMERYGVSTLFALGVAWAAEADRA